MNSYFDVSQIQSRDKGVYYSLINNINRGENYELIYHCSLGKKRSKKLTFFTNLRIIVLLTYKNSPPTLGYIERIQTLPPWVDIPSRKSEILLSQIEKVQFESLTSKTLHLFFKKGNQNKWVFQFQNCMMARQWQTLILREKSSNKISIEKSPSMIMKEKEKQENIELNLQGLSSNEASIPEILKSSSSINKNKQNQELINGNKMHTKIISVQKENSSEKSSQYPKQQHHPIQQNLLLEVNKLKNEKQTLATQNQHLKATVTELKTETARLRIGKSVLQALKQEYERQHTVIREDLSKKQFLIQRLLQCCTDLMLEKQERQMEMTKVKKSLSSDTVAKKSDTQSQSKPYSHKISLDSIQSSQAEIQIKIDP